MNKGNVKITGTFYDSKYHSFFLFMFVSLLEKDCMAEFQAVDDEAAYAADADFQLSDCELPG